MPTQKPKGRKPKEKHTTSFVAGESTYEMLERTKFGPKSLPALKTDDLQYALFNLVRARLRKMPLRKMSPDSYERLLKDSEETVSEFVVAAIRNGETGFFKKIETDLEDWQNIIEGKITEPLLPNHKRLLEVLRSYGGDVPTKAQLLKKLEGPFSIDLSRQTNRHLTEMSIVLKPS